MRSGWVVGLLAVVVLAYISYNSLRTEGVGSRGPEVGEPLTPFAAPLADNPDDVVVNVNPEQACGLRGPGVLNVCALARRGPVVLAFVAGDAEGCERQVDALSRVAPEFPDVAFAAVGLRGDREELAATARERGWDVPIGHDPEGILAGIFALAVCPAVVFADADGRVAGTSLDELDAAALRERVVALRAGEPLP